MKRGRKKGRKNMGWKRKSWVRKGDAIVLLVFLKMGTEKHRDEDQA